MLGALLLAVLMVLMIVPDNFDYRMLTTGHAPESGSALSRILWLSLLSGSLLVILSRASLCRHLLRNVNPFLLAFLVLAVLSIVWSVEPKLTLRRDIRLFTIVLVCIAFALTDWQRRMQTVVRPVLTAVILGSIVFGLVAPALAIHQETSPELLGAWRGLTNHKNSLGALAGVTLLLWMHAWSTREVRVWQAVLAGIAAAVCVWLSRSATSMIATLFAAVFLGVLFYLPRYLHPYVKYVVAIIATALTVYALTMLRLIPGQRILLAPVTLLTDLDTTFTGRSEIWHIITEKIRHYPLLGTGYGAYWTGPDPQSPSYAFITQMNGFYPGSAHNGYLEVANDLGWVGLLCLFGYLGHHVQQTLRLFAIDAPQAGLYLTLFMQQAIANLSESHWFSVLSVHFVLMTLVSVAVAQHLLSYYAQMRYESLRASSRPSVIAAHSMGRAQ